MSNRNSQSPNRTFNIYLESKGIKAPANVTGRLVKHNNSGNATLKITSRRSIKNLIKALENLDWMYEKD